MKTKKEIYYSISPLEVDEEEIVIRKITVSDNDEEREQFDSFKEYKNHVFNEEKDAAAQSFSPLYILSKKNIKEIINFFLRNKIVKMKAYILNLNCGFEIGEGFDFMNKKQSEKFHKIAKDENAKSMEKYLNGLGKGFFKIDKSISENCETVFTVVRFF